MTAPPSLASTQAMIGEVAKVILAGKVQAVSPPLSRRSGWTVVLESGLSVRARDAAAARVVERLRIGDFVIIEGLPVPKGAHCELHALIILSNRDTALPVMPRIIPNSSDGNIRLESDDLLPWENTG